jgi:hypothetical protein
VKYILQHTGMGDYIICNALIRHLISDGTPHKLFVEKYYMESVSFMYNDVLNLEYECVNYNQNLNMLYKDYKPKADIIIGYEYLYNFDRKNERFDEIFYKQFNFPFNNRWDAFVVKRNKNRELQLFKQYNVEENSYIFLHDKPPYKINQSGLKTNTVVMPITGLTNNIFDYCYLIENASEIHCIDSSFKNLVDSLNINGKPLYYHLNRHPHESGLLYYSSNKHNWKHIDYFVLS